MARPTKYERRNRQLNIKLTEREHAWLLARATTRGMRCVDFGRAQLLAERRMHGKCPETPPHLDPLFIAEVARIGNNLNQLVRRFHQFHVPPPDNLGPLLAVIREIIGKGVGHGS